VVPLSLTAEGLLREVRANQRVERLRTGSIWQPTPYVFTTELGEPCDSQRVTRLEGRSQARRLPSSVGLHTLARQFTWSGWRDLNSRPLDPQIGPMRLSSVNHLSLVSMFDR